MARRRPAPRPRWLCFVVRACCAPLFILVLTNLTTRLMTLCKTGTLGVGRIIMSMPVVCPVLFPHQGYYLRLDRGNKQ